MDRRRGGHLGAAAVPGAEHDDVGADRRRVHAAGAGGRARLGQTAGPGVVVGEAVQVMVQGVQAGGRQDAGLAHAAAVALAEHAGPGDPVGGGDQHRAHRGPEALGQAHRHRVGEPAVDRQRDPGGHVGVPEPRPVQVHRHTCLGGPGAQGLQLVQGLDRSAAEVVGVLHRDGRGRDQVGPGVGDHQRQRDRGVQDARGVAAVDEAVGPGPGRHPAEGPVASQLRPQDVGGDVAEQLLTRLHEQPDPDHVGHRPGREEQPRLVTEQLGHPGLQRVQRGVLRVDVVTDHRRGHRLAHGGGGGGEGVGAQVDDRRTAGHRA